VKVRFATILREARYLLLGATLLPLYLLRGDEQNPFLEAESMVPILFAVITSIVSAILLKWAFPWARIKRWKLLLIIFTSALLTTPVVLGLQRLAKLAADLSSLGIMSLILSPLAVVGFAYGHIEPRHGNFLLTLIAFTLSVGVLEELTKQLPIGFFRDGINGPRKAAVVALASGVGFGVAEGILYSMRDYNGRMGYEIYVIRFVSCVGLHACWSATVALLWRGSGTLKIHDFGSYGGEDWATAAMLLLPVAFLHALYDTYLTFGLVPQAHLTAVGSFVFLSVVFRWRKTLEDTTF
jgi:RsiW-degrading membrane proteinase PrsW (M82 family)